MIMKWPETIPDMELYVAKWFLPENIACLWNLLKPGMTVIELGSWVGESSRFIAEHIFPNGHLYCIDHWEGSVEHNSKEYDSIKPLLYDTFLYNCWQCRKLITPVKANTISGLNLLYTLNVNPDLIYVDASHEYADVVNDIQISHSLFPDAILCGDDWTSSKEVSGAVTDFATLNKFSVRTHGPFWMIKK